MYKMISAHIMGGLGNQLFIIFACIAYALENNISFIFFHNKILAISHGSPRPTYWNNFLSSLKQFTTTKMVSLPLLQEKGHGYKKILPNRQNFKLHGYFQSYKYFQSQQEKIYKLIQIHKQREKIKHLYSKYFYTSSDTVIPNIVALHFRIGDYKYIRHNNLSYHHILSIDYYIAAIKGIMQKLNNQHLSILYFGEKQDENKIKGCIQQLKNVYPTIQFVQCSYTISDWQQLLLMSCCQHHIIANSTFSWWGAYFNDYENKLIFYPHKWFGPLLEHTVTKDMFPEHWHRIMEG